MQEYLQTLDHRKKRKVIQQKIKGANADEKVEETEKTSGDVSNEAEKIPEKIVIVYKERGQLMFLIKWEGIEKVYDLIPAKIANIKYPQLVFKFYEERITWISPDSVS